MRDEFRPVYYEVMAHAEEAYPREACGVLLRVGGSPALVYRRIRNIAGPDAARDRFVLSPRDWASAENDGEIVAVVHSHPDASAEPSVVDRVMCHRTGVPWYVVQVPGGVVRCIEPAPLPLEGRVFVHGVVDCYTLARDYYAQRLGIELPEFERADGWWERGEKLYVANFERAGFVHVGHPHEVMPREHDAVLITVRSSEPNHSALMVDGGRILHHLYGRLSGYDVWGGYWQRNGTHVLRHRSLA